MTTSLTPTSADPAAAPGPTHIHSGAQRLSLLCGAVLLVVGTAVSPAVDPDTVTYLAAVAEAPGRASLGGLLFLLGHLFVITPILALAVTRGVAGSAALVAGVAAAPFAALGLARQFEVALATTTDPALGAEVLEAAYSMSRAGIVVLPAVVAQTLGLLVLVVALRRRRLLPAWPIATVVLGSVGVFIGGDGSPVGVAGSALLGATVVALGTTRRPPAA